MKVLEDKAEGLFQYARLLEVQLAQQKVCNEGLKVKIEELDGLPQGLGEMYDSNFRRVFEDKKEYESSKNVIAAIVASTEKVPEKIMRDAVLGREEEKLEAVKVGLVESARCSDERLWPFRLRGKLTHSSVHPQTHRQRLRSSFR